MQGRDHGGEGDSMKAHCAACKAPVERLDLIAGLCPSCLEAGAPIPLGESDRLTEKNLKRAGRVKRDATPGDTVKHEATSQDGKEREALMSNLKPCRYCGKEMPKGSLFRHEHVMCDKRPHAAPADVPKTALVAVHAKRPVKRATAKALVVLREKAVSLLRTADEVNHPAHYNRGRIEAIDFIADQNLGFHLGNVVKYIVRNMSLTDLKKAAWYLNREIARQENRTAA
jgi:hypothetical protein